MIGATRVELCAMDLAELALLTTGYGPLVVAGHPGEVPPRAAELVRIIDRSYDAATIRQAMAGDADLRND